jgi:C4-dicarboxylate-specific signal transduction histidine kinase
VEHAAETIQRLRGMFRKQLSARTLINLNGIVEDVVRLLRSDMMAKGIRVEFRRSEPLPNVFGDPVQLRQVVLNLLVNAGDAITLESGGDREIHIETRETADGAVALVMRDTGGGAAKEDLESLFEPFASTKPDGLGLGLSISRSILNAHLGRIWATRNDVRGLSLHVELPVATVKL